MDQNMDNPNPPSEDQPQQSQPQNPPSMSEQPPVSEPPTAEPSGDISKDAKQWGMFCHLAGLAGFLPVIPFPIGNVLGPLILWLVKKDEFAFVDENGKEALNFQISMSIYLLACFLLCFIFIGFILVPAVVVFNLVMVIIASVESSKGTTYRYPLCIRLVK